MSEESKLITWDIYEIESGEHALHGVKMRGRIRKYSVEKNITCLVENASDKHNVVRFAVPANSSPQLILEFVKAIAPQSVITRILENMPNPVLSKITINDTSRYEI